jgi:hypothetical protein
METQEIFPHRFLSQFLDLPSEAKELVSSKLKVPEIWRHQT